MLEHASLAALVANQLPPQLLNDLPGGSIRVEHAMTSRRFGAACQPYVLSLFRFITGLLLFQYGVAKILKFPVVPHFAHLPPLIQAAGWVELVIGGLLMIGLFTRIVAFVLSGEMAFAYFLGHMFRTGAPVFLPLNNGGTDAVLFCFACLYLWTAGGGPLSVDAALEKRPDHSNDSRLGQPAE